MSATNGSQFFFWFTEASVEITPKLISVGVSARTAVRLPTSTRALNAPVPSSDDIDGLPVVVNQRNNSPCVPKRSTHLATRVRSTSLRPNRRQQGGCPGRLPHRHRSASSCLKTRRLRQCAWVEGGKQVFTFGAVNGGEELGCQRLRRAVVYDLSRFQRDSARAIAERILDLMQRYQNGDAIVPIEIGQNVHHPAG